MRGADKVICQAALVFLLFAMTSAPAKAQFGGMMGGGGFGGMGGMGGMIPGGMGGGDVMGMLGGGGGGDIMGMLGGGGGGEMMSMIPQLMRMAYFGGGHGRRHRRR